MLSYEYVRSRYTGIIDKPLILLVKKPKTYLTVDNGMRFHGLLLV
jgi:hypothetical protein